MWCLQMKLSVGDLTVRFGPVSSTHESFERKAYFSAWVYYILSMSSEETRNEMYEQYICMPNVRQP